MAAVRKKTDSAGMNELREDIRQKNFRRVYLLYGDEEYLVRQYRKALIQAVCGEGDSMNLNIHRDDTLDWGAVQDEILSMPFFAEKRLVVLDDTKLFRANRKDGASSQENDTALSSQIADFIPQIPESTVVLFTEHADEKKVGGYKGKTSVDKRGRLYKAVSKAGLAVQFSPPDADMLRKWVLGKLGAQKIHISHETLELFLSMTGTDMSHISTETEKLISLAGIGGTVRREDVMSLTSEILEGKVFRMIDMISQRDKKSALDLYGDLAALKEPEVMILIMMMRQFEQLLAVRSIIDGGGSAGRVMEEMGLQKWQAEKAVRQARGFSKAALRDMLENCVLTQEKIQSGRLDKRLGLEMLIVRCSG